MKSALSPRTRLIVYLCGYSAEELALLLFTGFFAVFFTVTIVRFGLSNLAPDLFCLFFVGVTLFALIDRVVRSLRLKRMLAECGDELLRDFESAEETPFPKLRLGKRYFYVRNRCLPEEYRAYQCVYSEKLNDSSAASVSRGRFLKGWLHLMMIDRRGQRIEQLRTPERNALLLEATVDAILRRDSELRQSSKPWLDPEGP